MAPKLLVVDSINSTGSGAVRTITESRVLRMDGANTAYVGAQIGGTIPTILDLSTSNDQNSWHHNSAIQVGQYIYAQIYNEIWRYDTENPSNDWVFLQQIGPVNIFGGSRHISAGLLTTIIDGDPYLVGMFFGSTGFRQTTYTINTRTGAINVDSDRGVAGNFQTTGLEAVIIYKNFIYYSFNNTTWKYDLTDLALLGTGGSITQITYDTAITTWRQSQFAIWNGNLINLHFYNTGGGGPSLYIYDEGSNQFQIDWQSGDSSNSTISSDARSAMWVYNNLLHVLYLQGTSTASTVGWKLLRFTTGTNISLDADLSAGLPAGLQVGSLPGNNGAFSVYVDQAANPGGLPEVYLYYLPSRNIGTATYTQYFFDGSNVIAQDSGTSNAIIIPRSIDGGGGYAFTAGTPTVEIIEVNPLDDGQLVSFQAHGGGTASIQLYYSTDLDQPQTLATLSTPSVGSISGGNTNINVPADGSLQVFKWEATTDGVMESEDVKILLRIF